MNIVLKRIVIPYDIVPTIFTDNNAALSFASEGHRVTERSKHIRPKYYFVKKLVTNGDLLVSPISKDDQPADSLTKANGMPRYGIDRAKFSIV